MITQADWETLSETYRRLVHLRNHLYLHGGVPADSPLILPDDVAAPMATVRTIVMRRFYGQSEKH